MINAVKELCDKIISLSAENHELKRALEVKIILLRRANLENAKMQRVIDQLQSK